MTDAAASSDHGIGYGRPPSSTRFSKGHSGNPKGRPKGRRRDVPYDELLGQMVAVREDGRVRRVTAAEAFLLHITKRGMEGDSGSARASLAAIEEARARRACDTHVPRRLIVRSVTPGSVGCALDALGMAHKLKRYSEQGRYELQPWLVQQALTRFPASRRLAEDEQAIVVKATRTPHKVNWPEWWQVRPWL